MNEVEKLYEEYLGLGYNQNMAIAKMRFAGYDDDAVNGMMGMYSKKKSQDSGVSDSSSEAGSTESTSAGSVPQQPELGDSDTPVVDDRLQGLTGDFGALNYDIPSYSVSGSPSIDPSMMPMGKDSGIKLNAESFLNGGDPSFERLFHGLHSHSFQNWAYQNEYVDADFLKEHTEEFGYTPFAYTYGHVLDKIAMKQTLDEKTQENIKSGMSVEDALAQNDVLTKDLNMAWEDWRKGKNKKSGKYEVVKKIKDNKRNFKQTHDGQFCTMPKDIGSRTVYASTKDRKNFDYRTEGKVLKAQEYEKGRFSNPEALQSVSRKYKKYDFAKSKRN